MVCIKTQTRKERQKGEKMRVISYIGKQAAAAAINAAAAAAATVGSLNTSILNEP